jgi:hypothetical protein
MGVVLVKSLIEKLCPSRQATTLLLALYMGLVVALSLTWSGKGLHVAGLFSLICSSRNIAVQLVLDDSSICAPPRASSTLESSAESSLESWLDTSKPLVSESPASESAPKHWLIWMVGGIFLGGLVSHLLRSRSFEFIIERGRGVSSKLRLLLAGTGGILAGIGAAIAGGCTSSLGLTASSLLSVAGFGFLLAFFIGGFCARMVFGRTWQ